jgi:DNA-directed RNA polymerase subunit RPC12/RpoP
MFFSKKKKKYIDKMADRVIKQKLVIDPDLEWYCPECKAQSKHLGGTWIQCPNCNNRNDGKTRKMKSVTACLCVWCNHTIMPSSIMKDNTARCSMCKEVVPVKFETTSFGIEDKAEKS